MKTNTSTNANKSGNGAGSRDIQVNSISEALSLLDAAAQRGSEEFKKLLSNDFDALKRTVVEVTPQVREALAGLGRSSAEYFKQGTDRAMESTKEAARVIDESAHENAWVYIGGAALAGAAIGYWAGCARSHSFDQIDAKS